MYIQDIVSAEKLLIEAILPCCMLLVLFCCEEIFLKRYYKDTELPQIIAILLSHVSCVVT